MQPQIQASTSRYNPHASIPRYEHQALTPHDESQASNSLTEKDFEGTVNNDNDEFYSGALNSLDEQEALNQYVSGFVKQIEDYITETK